MTAFALKHGYTGELSLAEDNCNCHGKNPNAPGDLEAAHADWAKTNTHASDCPEHPNNTRSGLPNFMCGDVKVDWYKYIGRGMKVSRELTRHEINEVFKKCFESLK